MILNCSEEDRKFERVDNYFGLTWLLEVDWDLGHHLGKDLGSIKHLAEGTT
jgi:hypothetical protein